MKYPDLENFLVRAVETYQYNLEHYPEENPTMLGALDEEFNESWTLKFEDDTAKRKEAEKTVQDALNCYVEDSISEDFEQQQIVRKAFRTLVDYNSNL